VSPAPSGCCPQSSLSPDGITVADLVARGRYPHQRLLRQWSGTDGRIVGEVMAADPHHGARRSICR